MSSTRSVLITASFLLVLLGSTLLQATAAGRGGAAPGGVTIPGYGNMPGFTIPGVPGGSGGYIPGYGNPPKGWSGGYGGGYSTPSGSRSFGGVTKPSATVCKAKGPCYGKKLACPAKCYKSWSSAGRGYGGGGGSGSCTIDCKKCVAYC